MSLRAISPNMPLPFSSIAARPFHAGPFGIMIAPSVS